MKIETINSAGQFENWPAERLHELLRTTVTDAVGHIIIFENEQVRIWSIHLPPGGCLPFHKHNNNYSWVCLTDGKAISSYENGSIKEITYQKGDLSYYDYDNKGELVHDLKNIGETVLEFLTTEYK